MINDKTYINTIDNQGDMDMMQLLNTATANGGSTMKTISPMERLIKIMRVIAKITLFLTIILMAACGTSEKAPETPQQKQLTVLVYDISASNNKYGILKEEHLESIYKGVGEHGGGRFYGLHIKAHSLEQEPLRIKIPGMGITELSDNYILRAKQKKNNEKLRKEFLKGEEDFVATASALIQPKSKPFSDIENAMKFLKQIIGLPPSENSQWQINVLIVSDMVNDLPPNNGHDKMEPVQLAEDVEIAVVRPHPDVNLSEIFPGANINTAISIEDGIEMLFPRKN